MPAPKNIKSNGKVLQSSDPCPRGCGDVKSGFGHLVSDHDDAKYGACSKCACIIQDVRSHIGRDTGKTGA